MKLIIDIPEETKAVIDRNGTNEIVIETIWQAVKNGTPIPDNAPTVDVLDKIRAEIYQLHCHPKLDFIKTDEVVDMALDIIDKYKGDKE